jgi:uncharacterized repeat protein (TIGR03803 family)
MPSSRSHLTKRSPFVHSIVVSSIGMLLSALPPGIHAAAADAGSWGPDARAAVSPMNPKGIMQSRLVRPTRPPSSIRPGVEAGTAPVAAYSHEIVLHHFSSLPRGGYPATGVIRDHDGNLYGTTNGAYSDVGGGGPHDAGLVFKIDSSGHETVLYRFTGGADGGTPNGLVRDAAGNLYGTASLGGASGAGVVFEIDVSGNETVLYSFSGGNDGGNPNAVIRDRNGNLYGTTGAGGASGYGVVFRLDGSGRQTILHAFTGAADGAYPSANIALDPLGNFYGSTNNGGNQMGAAGAGVVFRIDPAGQETVLYTFTGGNDGANPNGVLRDRQGALYGVTSAGGSAGAGVVFELDASGHQSVLYTFTGGNDGGYASAGVTRDWKGDLFGTTNGGGASGSGVVFKVDASGHETVLHTFARGAVGDQPDGSGVVLDSAGNLYGTAAFSGEGGAGTVYKLDKDGNATVIYAFPGNEQGQYPYNSGVMLGPDGGLYGTTFYGGRRGAGVVYRLGENREERVLYDFSFFTPLGFSEPSGGLVSDPAGNLFGVTFLGQTNVGFGFGVVYRLDREGHATVLHNFTDGGDGGIPNGPLVLDAKGNVYGTAGSGGTSGSGVVFKIDAAGVETVLYSFSGGVDGANPVGNLVRDSAGNLYGTTQYGGLSGNGVVFKLDALGHETVLYSFTGGADGANPFDVILDAAGNLYGTTNDGGVSGAGVVYKIDRAGHETVLYSFTGGADGGYPVWVQLARDAAGNLYGTTVAGGSADDGVVFKVDQSGHETVLHNFTGGDDGRDPYTGVVLGPQGQLFGATPFGGKEDVGVIYELKP